MGINKLWEMYKNKKYIHIAWKEKEIKIPKCKYWNLKILYIF